MKPILRKEPEPKLSSESEVEFWIENRGYVLYLQAKDTHGEVWTILSIGGRGIFLFGDIRSEDIPTDDCGRITLRS